jgi:hypothetical protein
VRRWWSRGWWIRAEGTQQVRCSMRRSGALCYKYCNRLRSLASRCPSHLHTRNLQPKNKKIKKTIYYACSLSLSLSLSHTHTHTHTISMKHVMNWWSQLSKIPLYLTDKTCLIAEQPCSYGNIVNGIVPRESPVWNPFGSVLIAQSW